MLQESVIMKKFTEIEISKPKPLHSENSCLLPAMWPQASHSQIPCHYLQHLFLLMQSKIFQGQPLTVSTEGGSEVNKKDRDRHRQGQELILYSRIQAPAPIS